MKSKTYFCGTWGRGLNLSKSSHLPFDKNNTKIVFFSLFLVEHTIIVYYIINLFLLEL